MRSYFSNSREVLRKILFTYFLVITALTLMPFDPVKKKLLFYTLFLSVLIFIIFPYFFQKRKVYKIDKFISLNYLDTSLLNSREWFFLKVKYILYLLKNGIPDFYQDVKSFALNHSLLVLGYLYFGAKMLAYQLLFITVPKTQTFIHGGTYANEKEFFSGLLIADILGIAWDSVHYLAIAKYGYVAVSKTDGGVWAFSPLFPFIISKVTDFLNYIDGSSFGFIFNIIGIRIASGNYYALSAVLVANFFSFVSMFVFYKVACTYLVKENSTPIEIRNGKLKATLATAFFCFFPTNFAYMTVGYTESLFFTNCLIAWYFFTKGLKKTQHGEGNYELFIASLFAGLTYLSRYPGGALFAIFGFTCLFYLIKNLLKENWQISKLYFWDGVKVSSFFIIPVIWQIYLSNNGADLTQIQKAYWGVELIFPIGGWNFWFNHLPTGIPDITPLVEFWSFVMLIFILSIASIRYSWHLTFYSLTFIALYTSATGIAAYSVVRFVGSIWPAYLQFSEMKSKKNFFIILGLLVYFYFVGVYWLSRWSLRLFWG